MDSATNISNF